MSGSDSFRGVKEDAKERLSGDIEQLKANFSQLRSDVTSILSNAFGAGRSSAKGGVDSVRGQATAAVDRVKGGYEDLKSRGNDSVEQLTQTIMERPVTSALVAFGVGFVLAKVLIRR